jgi:hypothetical protein
LRFAYTDRDVDPLPGETGLQTVHEPLVMVRFIGPSRTCLIRGLLDTGAAITLLPRSFMAKLGVEPTAGRGVVGTAAGGLSVQLGTLDLEIRSGRTAYRWSARVGFAPRTENVALLGRDGFLDHFRATFDGGARIVTLRPSGQLPPPQIDDTL